MGWRQESKAGPTAQGQVNKIESETKGLNGLYVYEIEMKDADLALSSQWIKEGMTNKKNHE